MLGSRDAVRVHALHWRRLGAAALDLPAVEHVGLPGVVRTEHLELRAARVSIQRLWARGVGQPQRIETGARTSFLGHAFSPILPCVGGPIARPLVVRHCTLMLRKTANPNALTRFWHSAFDKQLRGVEEIRMPAQGHRRQGDGRYDKNGCGGDRVKTFCSSSHRLNIGPVG